MLGLALCILAFLTSYVAGRRSLGAGLQTILVVGFLYGLARGRYPDGMTHFPFDAAVVGLYLGYLPQRVLTELEQRSDTAGMWVRALMIWPVICMTFSPLLEQSQPFVVQIVGLRGAALMLPCVVIGARIQREDLDRLAPTVAILVCVALGFSAIEYVFGVEAILPKNALTELIYRSQDIVVGHESYHRIPSMFVNAHVYGAAMLFSIPFLVHGLEGEKRVRLLCTAGLGAAVLGVFLCGARMPVIILGAASVYALTTMRMRFTTLLAFAVICASGAYLVTHNERLQRFETLGDTAGVEGRIGSSLNLGFFDLLGTYPLGAGLASAFGTSIPFFMSGLANHAIGIENEYGHILVEQGIPGLLLWMGFVGWLIFRGGGGYQTTPLATSYATALTVLNWMTAFIGVGILTGVPTGAMFLLLCGMRVANPPREKAKLALRHVTRARRDGPLRAPGRAPPRAPGSPVPS